MNLFAIAAATTAAASCLLYCRRRRWIDAALVAAAGAALVAMLLPPAGDTAAPATVTVPTDAGNDAIRTALLAVPAAPRIVVQGHGLRDAQWRDVPARPATWQPPRGNPVWLDFPRTVNLGRAFALTVRRGAVAGPWRLQLLAENGQVLDEAKGGGAQLTVQWLPPVPERLVLRARLLDGAGKAWQEGPVPLTVAAPLPLQVVGRFGSPSFDTRVLNELLADSHALLDWQTVLGKAVTRTEAPAAPLTAPHATVIDAAWFEQQGSAARGALLAQVAQGMPLIVLGGNAGAPATWQGALGLRLVEQAAATEKEDTRQIGAGGTQLALAPAPFHPRAANGWRELAEDGAGKPWSWQRDWGQGRIVWLDVAGWHRYAITARAPLGQWWQRVLDSATTHPATQPATRAVSWLLPDPMPVPGLRTELCAQGVAPGAPVQVDGATLAWQARPEHADAACVALWPRQAGWLTARTGESSQDLYVYAGGDWPAWQDGLRRDATARYLARALPVAAQSAAAASQLPAWPFALLFATAMLGLWWRERR